MDVLHRVVKAPLGALAAAALVAGCGGGESGTQAASAPPPAASVPAMTAPAPQPTATTNTPPPKRHQRAKPQRRSSDQPLRVTAPYKCNRKPLKALAADGRVKVLPAIVRPGQRFNVIVTDPHANVALVSLAGVAPKPIEANARRQGHNLTATVQMPSSASCGNKLLEIEGDVSAEAYVAVAR